MPKRPRLRRGRPGRISRRVGVNRRSAPTAEAPAPSPPLTSAAPSTDRATTAGASNLVATPPDLDGAQPGTVEIPPANSVDASQQQPPSPALESQPSDESSEVARYREEQSGQFESEGELSTPFGMQLREARRTLKSGEEADGLLITAVEKNSPAAAVGLHAYSHGVHDALTGVAIVGALVLFMVPGGQFAILLIPALASMQVGESYDMIIGVDGTRVTNFLDFQDSDARPSAGRGDLLKRRAQRQTRPGDDAGAGQRFAGHQLIKPLHSRTTLVRWHRLNRRQMALQRLMRSALPARQFLSRQREPIRTV